MANNYFQFKDFIIYQDKCGMKVCTDACILGAWAADKVIARHLNVDRCLDIGTGTGLLSLMLAQKTSAVVDAIEIDENAFKQANGNFKGSHWNERLQAFQVDAKHFFPAIKYHFIITNPPFYEDALLSPKKNKNVARHDEGLKLDELIAIIKRSLHNLGSFALLLPYQRIDYFENIAAENNFFLQEKLLIKQTPEHTHFRGILLFGQTKGSPLVKELIIKNGESYTGDFIALMKDYYLNL